ncbi:MAG: hypothetical protein HY089_06280 [Ignavibacteriales bacterium]|nr:hypothetical protein [Ignavibacteriales bacterium]
MTLVLTVSGVIFSLLGIRCSSSPAPIDPGTTPSKPQYRITGYEVGRPIFDLQSSGDTWMPAWSNDGNLYTASDDGLGFDNHCVWSNQFPYDGYDISFNRLTGNPLDNTLHGVTLQCLREYNAWAGSHCGQDTCANPIPEWKATNTTSVNGNLYMAVTVVNDYVGLPRYVSLVRSSDKGMTWLGQGNAKPKHISGTFSDIDKFNAPFFVDYGQDKGIDGDSTWPDNANKYIYAISPTGIFTGISDLYLGRVLRANIDHLERTEWEFITNYTDVNGARSPIWGPVNGSKKAILGMSVGDPVKNKLGWTTVQWIAPLGKYLMMQWYYADCANPSDPHCFGSPWDYTHSYWQLYQADHVWGPWTQVGATKEWTPEGLYQPVMPTRFVDPQGVKCDGGVCSLTMWVLTTGDFATSRSEEFYHLGWAKMTLTLVPVN